jgi:hypothetical protein
MARRVVLALAVLLGALAAAPALADQDSLKHAADAVPGHPGLTYEDLVRQAVPDLADSPDGQQVQGHFAKPPRHLAGKNSEGDPADPAVLGSIEDRRILVGGKKRLVLLADLGGKEGRVEGLALLMLFDDAGKAPKLLDAADVGIDKDSGFAEPSVLPLGPGDSALVTYSEHNDADITLGGYMMVSPVGDRLRMIDTFRVTSESLCSWGGVETANFSTAADPGRPYRQIVATVKAVFTHTGEEGCGDEGLPKAQTLTYRAAYRWNAAQRSFRQARSTLGGLDALNKKLFE